jgi:hypothetical protein
MREAEACWQPPRLLNRDVRATKVQRNWMSAFQN